MVVFVGAGRKEVSPLRRRSWHNTWPRFTGRGPHYPQRWQAWSL